MTGVQTCALPIYQRGLAGSPLTAREAALVKQVDDDMLYYDLKVLLNDAPQGPAPVMQTAFSYQVLPFAQVEREYLELFEALMSEVHGA